MQEGIAAVRGIGLVRGDSIEIRGGTESGLRNSSSGREGGGGEVVVAAMGGRGGGAGGEKPSGPTRMNNSTAEPPKEVGGGGGIEQPQQAAATAKDCSAMEDEELRISLKQQVLDITSKVEEMERLVTEVNRKRASLWKAKNMSAAKPMVRIKDRDKDKPALSNKKQQQLDASRRDIARAKRMAELMRQLGTVLRQITQHKWAWPFMEPVDVQGLGLNDYYEIIKKPMDLGTIRDRMEIKDGTGYKHVQEICDDIRLVFSNAMKYNPAGSDVHIMAKALSEKFEEKWKAVLEPKLQEEDIKRRQEDREANAKEAAAFQAAEEAAIEKLASDASRQLEELDKSLEDLKQKATPRCRVMSIEEKRQLGHSLGRLPADNLQRVIQIIAQKNPGFNASADEVEVDIDAQEPATLWRLHRYVQSVTSLKDKTRALVQSSPISTKRDNTLVTTETLFAKRQHKVPTP
ncbi:unnamed protein product [Calypogeia fissa]